MARSRGARAALYVALGVCAVATLRLRARPLNEFHAHLTPGITLGTALHRLDAVYAEHPRQWIHVAVWGTSREFALEPVHEAARSPDALAVVNWYGGRPRSSAEIDATAKALGSARQVWFTFRTATGYLQFFVALDDSGRVREVSGMTGHQA